MPYKIVAGILIVTVMTAVVDGQVKGDGAVATLSILCIKYRLTSAGRIKTVVPVITIASSHFLNT